MEVKFKENNENKKALSKTQFGSVFRYETMFYMVTDSYDTLSIGCVNIETGRMRTFDKSMEVCALKAEVTIDD